MCVLEGVNVKGEWGKRGGGEREAERDILVETKRAREEREKVRERGRERKSERYIKLTM